MNILKKLAVTSLLTIGVAQSGYAADLKNQQKVFQLTYETSSEDKDCLLAQPLVDSFSALGTEARLASCEFKDKPGWFSGVTNFASILIKKSEKACLAGYPVEFDISNEHKELGNLRFIGLDIDMSTDLVLARVSNVEVCEHSRIQNQTMDKVISSFIKGPLLDGTKFIVIDEYIRRYKNANRGLLSSAQMTLMQAVRRVIAPPSSNRQIDNDYGVKQKLNMLWKEPGFEIVSFSTRVTSAYVLPMKYESVTTDYLSRVAAILKEYNVQVPGDEAITTDLYLSENFYYVNSSLAVFQIDPSQFTLDKNLADAMTQSGNNIQRLIPSEWTVSSGIRHSIYEAWRNLRGNQSLLEDYLKNEDNMPGFLEMITGFTSYVTSRMSAEQSDDFLEMISELVEFNRLSNENIYEWGLNQNFGLSGSLHNFKGFVLRRRYKKELTQNQISQILKAAQSGIQQGLGL